MRLSLSLSFRVQPSFAAIASTNSPVFYPSISPVCGSNAESPFHRNHETNVAQAVPLFEIVCGQAIRILDVVHIESIFHQPNEAADYLVASQCLSPC